MGARSCVSKAKEKELNKFLFAILCVGFDKTREFVSG